VERELIEVTAEGGARRRPWLNRPESLNALSWDLVRELERWLA
jgi:hypothetical protein